MGQRESTAIEAENARHLAVSLEDRTVSWDFGSLSKDLVMQETKTGNVCDWVRESEKEKLSQWQQLFPYEKQDWDVV